MSRRLPNPPIFKNLDNIQNYINELVKIVNQQTTDTDSRTNTATTLLSTSLISIDSNYKAGDRTFIVANASAGPLTITFPPAKPYFRDIFAVKKDNSSTNAITVQVSGGGTIDGVVTAVLSAAGKPSLMFISDGTEYKIF